MAALTQWVNGGSLSALDCWEVQNFFSDPVGKQWNYGCFEPLHQNAARLHVN